MKIKTSRRGFVKAASFSPLAISPALSRNWAAPAADSPDRSAQSRQTRPENRADRPAKQATVPVTFPRSHTGRGLARVSCPLGGIGTGGIGLGGRGNLTDWQIFNRPDIGNTLQYSFPSLYVKPQDSKPFSAVIERRLLPPYDLQEEGLGFANVPGLPRFAEAVFHGSFPISGIAFEDELCPVSVRLDAFSPFFPLDADASGLPCAILTYHLHNPETSPVDAVVAWTLSNPVEQQEGAKKGEDGRRNHVRTSGRLTGLYMSNPALAQDDSMKGTFVVAALAGDGQQVETLPRWRGGSGWRVGPQHFWFEAFSKNGSLGDLQEPSLPVGCISLRAAIKPGDTASFRFLMAWHFPNRTPDRCGWEAPKGKGKVNLGNFYATQYADAWEVASHTVDNLAELEGKTRAFVDAMVSSTLPAAVKEAASANLSTLVSNTSFRIADGSFQGFEGCGDRRGLGFGTCTHVWNYEVATQFLFPSLARSMRETSFTYATNSEGHMDFRHKLPPSDEYWGAAAADGQMGQIVKLYLDWKLSGDDAWLRPLWPAARRALAYAWRPGGWDERKFGVMDGVQHNTYDVEFYGPNPMCSSWYLAALRAVSKMAVPMGDSELAHACREMAARGSRWIDENLFNGKHYIQQIRGTPQDRIASGLRVGMGTKDTLHPQFQVGDGCLVDQLIGQYMATVAGLGDLLDSGNIRKTLGAIYRLNYKHDLSRHASVQRVYALNDESALVICDFSEGHRPEVPMPYYAEVMTGYEYSAAMLMLSHGMVKEGVECIANVRRRYDGERANPYDETEYGRHYARAMASWAAYPLLSGFEFDGLRQTLALQPIRSSDDRSEFRCFWSAPTAWGNFSLSDRKVRILLVAGTLTLREILLPSSFKGKNASLGGISQKRVVVSSSPQGVSIRFDPPVTLSTDSPLQVLA